MNGTLPQRVTLKPPKPRKYAHFDDPLSLEQLKKFSVSERDVAVRAFLPFLGYQKVIRKIDFSVFPPIVSEKPRDIRYASHTDSAIFSIYAQILSVYYENRLSAISLDNSVLAYRSKIGYNVPFAKSLIDEIRFRGSCHVICLDISKFFDNISHILLKNSLCNILNVKRLPEDIFKIFERTTTYEYVSREDLENKFGKLKGGRICQIDTFRSAVRPLVKKNPNPYGIPQGTPLSGLFANISMLEFDAALKYKVSECGGSYRRYSDDIAIVLPSICYEANILDFAENLLTKYGLSFNKNKTCRTTFSPSAAGQSTSGDVLQYLGFTFDGIKILIRPESIKNFYAKMKGNIDRYVKDGIKRKKIPPTELRKRVLIGRFTHWGDSRNFIQYAYRAARELKAPEIKRQLRNHVAIFDRQWAKAVKKYYS